MAIEGQRSDPDLLQQRFCLLNPGKKTIQRSASDTGGLETLRTLGWFRLLWSEGRDPLGQVIVGEFVLENLLVLLLDQILTLGESVLK